MQDSQTPPPIPPDNVPHDLDDRVRHSFRFTGSALEYFSIWIVNTALTVLTLGLYSPWAKVRRERYLMSHTELAGSQFEYTANPWRIFKGRLLLFGIFIFVAVTRVVPVLWLFILFPLVALVWPWILASALRFRARYTSYRNLSFHFIGSPTEAFTHCVLPKGITVLTMWLMAPWAQCVAKRYAVNNLQYGATSFKSPVTVRQMYGAYVGGVVLFAVGSAIALSGTSIIGLDAVMNSRRVSLSGNVPLLLTAGLIASIGFGLIGCARGYIRLASARSVWNGASLGSYSVSWNPSMRRYLAIEVVNIVMKAVTLGLATPWCVIRIRRFLLEDLELIGPRNIDEFVGQKRAEVRSLGDQAAEAYDLDVDFGF